MTLGNRIVYKQGLHNRIHTLLHKLLGRRSPGGILAMAGVDDRPRRLLVQTEIYNHDSVQLLVRDSGVGIDSHTVEKLFDAFYTTKAHGMGTGLAISRSTIESHQGYLWAMANNGPRATFGFCIPCASVGRGHGSSSRPEFRVLTRRKWLHLTLTGVGPFQ